MVRVGEREGERRCTPPLALTMTPKSGGSNLDDLVAAVVRGDEAGADDGNVTCSGEVDTLPDSSNLGTGIRLCLNEFDGEGDGEADDGEGKDD